MKPFLFSISMLAAFPAICQEEATEHVKISKNVSEEEVNYFPHIDRFYEGEIPVEYLGDIQGIQVAEGWKVISFSISYPYGNMNKIVPVKGNLIPDEIIEDIYANSLGEMIFITNIVTLNEENKRVHLVPMNLTPVK